MRQIILIFALSFISTITIAQDTIGRDLLNLAKLKLWSEVHGVYPNRKKNEIAGKRHTRDSIYNEYISLL